MSTRHFNPQRNHTLRSHIMISAILLAMTVATNGYAKTEVGKTFSNSTSQSHELSIASSADSSSYEADEPQTRASAGTNSASVTVDAALNQPMQLVQRFVETMDYHLLSEADKEVWDEETWNQIQSDAMRSNEVRLSVDHPFHTLERVARAHVTILAKNAERAEDGSVRVITEMTYPYVLMLIDEYVETDNSFAYEQLRQFSQTLEDEALNSAQFEVHRSSMPWKVQNGGVFVDAAQMQEDRESLQARGW